MPLLDATGYEPKEPSKFEPIPPGHYPVVVTGVEEKPTKDKGSRVVLTLEVLDGDHKGRKQWASYMRDAGVDPGTGQPKDTQCVDIATDSLKNLMQAIDLLKILTYDEFLNHTAVVELATAKKMFNGEYPTEVRGYFPMSKLDELTKPKPLNNPIPKDSEIPF